MGVSNAELMVRRVGMDGLTAPFSIWLIMEAVRFVMAASLRTLIFLLVRIA